MSPLSKYLWRDTLKKWTKREQKLKIVSCALAPAQATPQFSELPYIPHSLWDEMHIVYL